MDVLGCFYFLSLPVQCFQLLVVLGQLDILPKTLCKSKPFALTSRKASDSYKGNVGQNPTMLNLSMAQGFISPFFSLAFESSHHPPPPLSLTSPLFPEFHFFLTP